MGIAASYRFWTPIDRMGRTSPTAVNSVSFLGFVKTDLASKSNMTTQAGASLPMQHAFSDDLSGRFAEPDGKAP